MIVQAVHVPEMGVSSVMDKLPAVADYAELGLDPPTCIHWISRKKRYCGQPAIGTTDLCTWHGGRELELDVVSIAEIRAQLTQNVVPVAMQRLMDIILDDEASYTDVIRAAFGIMDRVGLGAVQGLQIDAKVHTEAPLAAIQALLTRVAERLPAAQDDEDDDIIDVEILD